MHDKESLTNNDPTDFVTPEDVAEMRTRVAELEVWRAGLKLSPAADARYLAFLVKLENDVSDLMGEEYQPAPIANVIEQKNMGSHPVNIVKLMWLETWGATVTFASVVTAQAYGRLVEILRAEIGQSFTARTIKLGAAVVELDSTPTGQSVDTDGSVVLEEPPEVEKEISIEDLEARVEEVLVEYGLSKQDLYQAALYLYERQKQKADSQKSLEEQFVYYGITPLKLKTVEKLEAYKPSAALKLSNSEEEARLRARQAREQRKEATMKIIQLAEFPEFEQFLKEIPRDGRLLISDFIAFLAQFSEPMHKQRISMIVYDLSRFNPANKDFANKRKRPRVKNKRHRTY